MVSSLIISPKNGETIDRSKGFTLSVKVLNMQLGTFDNPQTLYYRTPQVLNKNGIIIGHQHIVVQQMPNENPQEPLDPRNFDFFRGLDFQPSAGNVLSVDVPAGKIVNDGPYRICSITGQRSHAPVIMPVAQRGSQDDCIRVNMVAGGGGAGGAAKNLKNNDKNKQQNLKNNDKNKANNQQQNSKNNNDKNKANNNNNKQQNKRRSMQMRRALRVNGF
ncbi:hypothetical protein HK102_001736 [Quaeritorhiza haematococci]|nr:hypothetical protein HK102_001736 [Quaeritorhiza haematococci]